MLEDLISNIIRWMQQGDHIILAINLNQYVIDREEAVMLHNIGLYEAIIEKHREKGLAPTYQRG